MLPLSTSRKVAKLKKMLKPWLDAGQDVAWYPGQQGTPNFTAAECEIIAAELGKWRDFVFIPLVVGQFNDAAVPHHDVWMCFAGVNVASVWDKFVGFIKLMRTDRPNDDAEETSLREFMREQWPNFLAVVRDVKARIEAECGVALPLDLD